MTSQEIAMRIHADLGPTWPRNRTLPDAVLAPLCEALWDEGVSPTRRIVQRCLPGWNEHAMGPGVVAWRIKKGLPQQGVRGPRAVPTNAVELAKIVSLQIASAPHTCFDPANDGRWPTPSLTVLAYLSRIENQSVRDAMALFAILRADRQQFSMRNQIANFTYIMRRVMIEQSIDDVSSIDANDLLFRIHVGEVGKGLTDHQRRTLIGQWSAVRNVYEEYAEKLTTEQLEKLSRFFIKPLTDRRKLARHTPWAGVHREQQERVKNKTDAVQQQFYRIRYVAGIRCNQVRRLYAAATETIAFVEKNHRSYPHDFHYEETVQTPGGRSVRQRVELTLWDAVSVREHARGLGYREASETTRQRRWREGRYAAARVPYYVEYNATVSLEKAAPAEPFWFLDLFRQRVFRRVEARDDSDLADKREEFDRKWGYQSSVSWSDDGMLSLGSADYRPLDFLHAQEGHEFLPYEGIYAAALFGGLMIRMGTITGARGGEIQQIAQSPDCFKQLDNVGPKAATRWLLRMVPKGRKERADYYIDDDTKNHLVELVRFQCERLGTTLLPVVKSEYGKTPPDRYVLQWNGHGIDLQVLNTLIRFLLHGILFQALDGTVVQLTSHLLRHAFANEMAELKVSVDIIASLLHQRDKTVTKYYSRPTPTQVIRAAEMIFVDRIDVGAEALRSPDEIGQMLKDAEGKLGALTEVFGGTCVVGNMCPAKFACVGCAGNAPDPAKRYQIQQKLAWAKQQVSYAVREHLPAEEVKLGQLIADCKLVMEEMDLIEAARADRSQSVTVQQGPNSR
ncbi:MAG TPA: site-specific integrase [Candidatus Binataceae bacterium]|nr:site-specific integrase [Candidatus Binataceae bacterium]